MFLQVKDIHVFYGKSHILRGVSLDVKKGEIVGLFGRNGAGKTTTLKTIMGLVNPRQGGIFYAGENLTGLPPYRRAGKGIGYIPQEKLLFSKMTVYENLLTGIKSRKRNETWNLVLDLFPVLREKMARKASSLSGGEQQMLAIARALLTEPDLLLLDEPSTGLMPTMISRLAEVIRKLNTLGISVLIVEEKIPFALKLAHRIYVMDVGQIVYQGDAESLGEEDLFIRYLGVNRQKSVVT
ncbi:MAG: ABC transporter ATP-binding protein [Bacillota bacterium]